MIVTDSQKALALAIDEARDNREPLIRLDLEWAENVARQLAEARAHIAELKGQLAASRALVEQYGAEQERLAQDRDAWRRIAGERREKLAPSQGE